MSIRLSLCSLNRRVTKPQFGNVPTDQYRFRVRQEKRDCFKLLELTEDVIHEVTAFSASRYKHDPHDLICIVGPHYDTS